MKILLDENLNWRLERFLPGHVVHSVPRIGWAGIKNGSLLLRAQQEQYEVLISMDDSIARQQNMTSFRIALIALRAVSNRLEDTSPLMSQVLATLPWIKPGQVYVIGE